MSRRRRSSWYPHPNPPPQRGEGPTVLAREAYDSSSLQTAAVSGNASLPHVRAAAEFIASCAGSGNTYAVVEPACARRMHISAVGCWLRSISLNISPSSRAFSMSDASSAGSTAQPFDAARKILGAEGFRPLHHAGLVGVVENQRMQIAVAGMKHVGDTQIVFLR